MKGNLWMIALFIVALALFALIAFQLVRHSKDGCDYNSVNKSYIKTAPNCVINFMCTKNHVAFRDACGCGCQVSS